MGVRHSIRAVSYTHLAVLSCLSNDIFDGNEPNGKYEYLYDLYQKLALVVNEYLFEAEKDIRELREGE